MTVRKVAVGVGLIEAVSLIAYAISVVVNANRVHSTVGAPTILAGIFTIFGVLMLLLTQGINKGKQWARTPFMMSQLFAGIIAYTLVSGTGTEAKAAGLAILLLAAAGIYAIFRND